MVTENLSKNAKREFMPDGSDAERWIDPDTFIYKGDIYRLNPDFSITRVNHAI